MRKNLTHRVIACVLAVAALFAFSAAMADSLTYEGAWYGSYYGSYVVHDATDAPISSNTAVEAGAFTMYDNTGALPLPLPDPRAGNPPRSFAAYCVDIRDWLQTTHLYNEQTGTAFYIAHPYMATDLGRLASYVYDNSTTALTKASWGAANVQSAAFQIAVWEIVNDANPGLLNGHGTAYNVTSGDFYVTSSYSAATNLANTWLGIVNTGTYTIDRVPYVWDNACVDGAAGCTQSLVAFAVPEPETYAMLIAGLGLMGLIARRKRGKA